MSTTVVAHESLCQEWAQSPTAAPPLVITREELDWGLDRIARAVKEAAGWGCQNPSYRHPHDWEAGYALTVHRKDGNPAKCHPHKMVALCQRCHLRAQGRLRLYGAEDDLQFPLW